MNFIISDDGDLPRGLYCYVIVPRNGTPGHILQVYAKNKNNSIILSWMPDSSITEYQIFRGSPERFDGFFMVETDCGYFCDDGRGVLNESKTDPWL